LRVNAEGKSEEATVGRVKIERRSMVLVEAEKDGETYSCLIQNAETVRLIWNDRGEAKSVADLRKGDEVLIKISKQARHTGIAIDEDTWCER
jgi:3-dehydroquinate synthase II